MKTRETTAKPACREEHFVRHAASSDLKQGEITVHDSDFEFWGATDP